MEKNFKAKDWESYLPEPVCEQFPNYGAFYKKAWEIARGHVRDIEGMPQNPYMDEGFCDTQVWIWDTCFMSLFCKFAQEVFPGVETFKNFYEVLYHGASLPAILPTEKEPFWTGAKQGEPFHIQVHIADNPPLFAWAEYENALYHGDKAYIEELLYKKQSLQRHYDWLENLREKTRLPNVHCGTHWIAEEFGYKWECGVSGMDNTPRGREGDVSDKERPNNPNLYWFDAICQQALAAKCIARLFALIDDNEKAKIWEEKFLKKKQIVNTRYWDNKDKFYYDIDCEDNHFYKVPTIASFWALTSKIADRWQAESLVRHIQNENEFGGDIPLVSLSRSDGDFKENGKYWRGALWLPTAYASLKGLAEYGYYKEAQTLGYSVFKHMLSTYENYEPHTIWECYSPCKCEPSVKPNGQDRVRPDFCGWSALGPISIYLEFVLGFHTVNAFEKIVEWSKPTCFTGKIGVKNFRFGNIITDIIADGTRCAVTTNEPYTLKVNGLEFSVAVGENIFTINE